MRRPLLMIVVAGAGLVALGWAQEEEPAPSTPAASQPAVERRARPQQVEVLRDLLRDRERARSVRPRTVDVAPQRGESEDLFPEGSVEQRGGRLIQTEGAAQFRFASVSEGLGGRTMEILKNAWLERMEQDARSGMTEFIVSGEITKYRGTNYLLIRNYRRQVDNGNLTP